MSELDKFRELRQSISRAREACAGSNVQEKEILIKLIYNAIEKSLSLEFINITLSLIIIHSGMKRIKEYGDRLISDNQLCDLLNDLDKKIKKLEYNV